MKTYEIDIYLECDLLDQEEFDNLKNKISFSKIDFINKKVPFGVLSISIVIDEEGIEKLIDEISNHVHVSHYEIK